MPSVESFKVAQLNSMIQNELTIPHIDEFELRVKLADIFFTFLHSLKIEHKGMVLAAFSTSLNASFFEIDLPKNGEGLSTRTFVSDRTNLVASDNYHTIQVLIEELLNHMAEGHDFDRFEIVER